MAISWHSKPVLQEGWVSAVIFTHLSCAHLGDLRKNLYGNRFRTLKGHGEGLPMSSLTPVASPFGCSVTHPSLLVASNFASDLATRTGPNTVCTVGSTEFTEHHELKH